MKTADLHVHTTASDGTMSPADVVIHAREVGLSAIAITDHDTTDGISEAITAGSANDIEVIPAIEFSSRYIRKSDNTNSMIHLLGYYIDIDNADLQNELQKIIDDRDERNREIIYMFNRDGIDITYEQMKERFGDVIGRPHLAQILVENGRAKDTKDAFDRLIGKGMDYWIPRKTVHLERCFELIIGAGGIPIVAHPFEYKEHVINDMIQYCMSLGLKGVECLHSSHAKEQMDFLEEECDKYNLLKSGGSDFHGSVKSGIELGSPRIPYSWLEKIKEAKNSVSY